MKKSRLRRPNSRKLMAILISLSSHVGVFTARKRSLGQGNIFTPVCHSVHRGGMHGCSGGGACVVAPGGACVVLFGGVCMVLFGGACMVLFRGGVRGFFSFFGYNEIRSMSGRYASYWNAFLFMLRRHSEKILL